MKLKLTDDALRELTDERLRSGKAQLIRFDTEETGLAVVVGARGTTFVVHHRIGPRVHRETLGHWRGRGGDMGLPDARRAARRIVGKLEGREPTPGTVRRARAAGPTLAQACALYVAEMERTECRPTSIASIKREVGDKERGYLKAWLDRPLAQITGKECRERHQEMARVNGPHVANRVMRELRAIWNHVAREASVGTISGLPEGHVFPANPTIAVQWIEKSAKTKFSKRRGEPIADDALPAWHAAVMGLAKNTREDGKQRSGVRRDYNLLVVLTGLRRSDAASLRWEHVNLTDRRRQSRVWNTGTRKQEEVTLHPRSVLRPSPKGGADRAFALPLSTQAIEVLERRRRENELAGFDDAGWVFPTVAMKSDSQRRESCYLCRDLGMPPHERGAIVHIAEPKEDADELVSPHRLRDTYITTLGKLDPEVPSKLIKMLVNHSLGDGDVTDGYMSIDIEPLRTPQQRVADYLSARWSQRAKLVAV